MAIVILHGWSDDYKSFRDLKQVIDSELGAAPVDIRLADW